MESQVIETHTVKTVKGFYSKIYQGYANRDQRKLAIAMKQVFNDPGYIKLSAEKWKVPFDSSKINDNEQFGKNFTKVIESIREYHFQRQSVNPKEAFKVHMKTIVIVLRCLQLMGDNQYEQLCKALRIVIRATKKIFLSAYKFAQHDAQGNQVKNDLQNTLQRYKGARALKKQIKNKILPTIDNMQVSIFFVFHNYEQIQRLLIAPKNYDFNQHTVDINTLDNFYFQKGKYCLINENFKEAVENFNKITIKTQGQKKLVLRYLIPCKIFLGEMFLPKQGVQQEKFTQYMSLIQSIVKADFVQFNEAMLKYQRLWIKRGIYLLMDRLRIILWRNLIKKTAEALKTNLLDFQTIEKAVHLKGGEQESKEIICIVSNLVYEKIIRGYIYQTEEKKTLVLNKDIKKSFPKLSEKFSL